MTFNFGTTIMKKINESPADTGDAPVIEVRDAVRIYKKSKKEFRALDGISLKVQKGEILGIVGESGSGKSTMLKHIICLEKLTSGQLFFCGNEYTGARPKQICSHMQMIFQDAVGSFDPQMKLSKAYKEIYPLISHCNDKQGHVNEIIKNVGLSPDLLEKYPGQLSGGQCQRMAIAKAVAVSPEILLCDEITSALDVSVQAQIIRLMAELRAHMDISMIFVSHDLALVSSICDRIMVFKDGRCVEEGTSRGIIEDPKEDYTKRLLSSVLMI